MKKILLTLGVTLLSMNSLFAQDIAKKADGIYNGKLWISLMAPVDDDTDFTEGQEIKDDITIVVLKREASEDYLEAIGTE